MVDYSDQEAKTIETYDATARHWTLSHQVVNDWQETAERFKQLLPIGKILEVGCGGGRDAAELRHLGYDYFGTDASQGMVDAASRAVPHASFRQLNIYELSLLDEKFDGFWACAVLLHIPKSRITEALNQLKSVLRPGARGMISMKDGDYEEFEVRDKAGHHEERLFVYWRKEEFVEILRQNGFDLLDYEYRPVTTRTNWHVFFVALRTE